MKAENAYDFRKALTTCNKEGVCYNAEKTIKEVFSILASQYKKIISSKKWWRIFN